MAVGCSPVDADGHEVEDGGRAASDVEGDVEVAQHVAQLPVHVHLQYTNMHFSLMGLQTGQLLKVSV